MIHALYFYGSAAIVGTAVGLIVCWPYVRF